VGMDVEGCREPFGVGDRLNEVERLPGAVWPPFSLNGVGCCRIRRRPESPNPCSPECSGIIGDFDNLSSSGPNVEPMSREYRFLFADRPGWEVYERRLLVLLFLVIRTALAGVNLKRSLASFLS
jgi:hypothetical protein